MSQSMRMGRAGVGLSGAVARAAGPVVEQLERRCLFAAGALDTTFSSDGIVHLNHSGSSSDDGQAIVVQSDGKIVVGGATGSGTNYGDFLLARYNTDGTLDSSFGAGGKVVTDFPFDAGIYALAIQADGKILAGGTIDATSTWDWILARYNTNGTLDTTFDTDGYLTRDIFGLGFGDDLEAISVQPTDGKIVATGIGTSSTTSQMVTARFNIDGSPDTTFDGDGFAVMDFFGGVDAASDVLAQADGKIVVAGGSVPSGGYRRFVLVRYNSNGTLDTTFDTDGKASTDFGVSAFGKQIARQSDGKYVVGGIVAASGPTAPLHYAVARYNTNGSIDTTFGAGGPSAVPGTTVVADVAGHNAVKYGIAIQGDNKVLFGGYVDDPADTDTYFGLVRFTAAGALDTTFDTDGKVITDAGVGTGGFAGFSNGADVALQSDGRIVMTGGSFNSGTGGDMTTIRYQTDAAAVVYDWDASPFQSIDLVPGDPGVVTLIDSSDDGRVALPLGANTFKFYDTTYSGASSLYVSVNGLITFGTSPDLLYQNGDLTSDPPQASIAPLWDDWRTEVTTAAASGTANDVVLYQFDAANNRLIIEWSNVRTYGTTNAGAAATFQAILQLNTGATPGDMYFNYPDLVLDGTGGGDNGGFATVGIKNAGTVDDEVLINFNNGAFPYIQSGAAVKVYPVGGPPPPTGSSTINGFAYHDTDADGVRDAGEVGLGGATVFDDVNNNGVADGGEATATSAADGSYALTNLAAGSHNVRSVAPATYTSAVTVVAIPVDGDTVAADVAHYATVYTGTGGNDTYLLRRKLGDATRLEILIGGSVAYTTLASATPSLTFNLGTGDDSLTVEYANGNPTPSGGIRYDGGAGAGGGIDSLTVNGSTAADVISLVHPDVASMANGIGVIGVNTATVNGNAGADILSIDQVVFAAVTFNGGTESDRLNFMASNGSDTVDITSTSVVGGGNSAGFSSVEVLSVDALGSTDVINLATLSATTSLTILGGSQDDVINVGSPGNDVENISGPVTISGGTETDTVNYNDSANTFDDTYTITATSVARTAGANISFSTIERLVVNAGTNNNPINVNSASTGIPMTINGGNGNDVLTVGTGATTAVTFEGGIGADSALFFGNNSNETITVSGTQVAAGAKVLNYGGTETLTVDAMAGTDTITLSGSAVAAALIVRGGNGSDVMNMNVAPASTFSFAGGLLAGEQDTLNVNAGVYTFNADANTESTSLTIFVNNAGSAVNFNATQHLAALNLGAGTSATMSANGNRYLFTKGLVISASAKLDLRDNDLLWDYTGTSTYAIARAYILAGRDNPGGNGGITSTATATNDTVLAPVDNAVFLKTVWLGQTIDASTIIGKYTYYGDSNMDGAVTGDDYLAIDSNLGLDPGTRQWFHGDFNFDGNVTGDDYLAIDANLGDGTPTPLAYDEQQAEMIQIHSTQFGGKRYIKAVELAAAGKYKFGGKRASRI